LAKGRPQVGEGLAEGKKSARSGRGERKVNVCVDSDTQIPQRGQGSNTDKKKKNTKKSRYARKGKRKKEGEEKKRKLQTGGEERYRAPHGKAWGVSQ